MRSVCILLLALATPLAAQAAKYTGFARVSDEKVNGLFMVKSHNHRISGYLMTTIELGQRTLIRGSIDPSGRLRARLSAGGDAKGRIRGKISNARLTARGSFRTGGSSRAITLSSAPLGRDVSEDYWNGVYVFGGGSPEKDQIGLTYCYVTIVREKVALKFIFIRPDDQGMILANLTAENFDSRTYWGTTFSSDTIATLSLYADGGMLSVRLKRFGLIGSKIMTRIR